MSLCGRGHAARSLDHQGLGVSYVEGSPTAAQESRDWCQTTGIAHSSWVASCCRVEVAGVRVLGRVLGSQGLLGFGGFAHAPLHKAEQGLVPDDGEGALLLAEAEEVVHQRVDHPVGQRVLFVQEHLRKGRERRKPFRKARELRKWSTGALTTL